MSTPHNPDPESGREPRGESTPGSPEHPTEEVHPPASEQPTEQVAGHPSDAPTERVTPAAEHPAAPGTAGTPDAATPAGTPEASPAGGVAAPGGRGRRGRPRGGTWRERRWPKVVASVLAAVVLLVIGFGAGLAVGHRHGGGFDRHGGFGAHGRMHDGQRGGFGAEGRDGMGGFGGPGEMGVGGPGDMAGPGDMDGGRGMGDMRRGGPGGVAGGTALFGTVTSVNGASVVVTRDGGTPVTVVTTDRTRVLGTVGQLQPGDRVAVRLGPDNTALGLRVVPAVARGTVTAVAGDQVTLTEATGLTQAVDVSAVTLKPVVGDVVTVQGTVANSGATLKAQTLRQLPKAG
ncbi:MAG TPA: hypothetical protein VGH99_12380 [Pseudonocardia sp.]|jgi:hypothetical protein